MKLLKRISIFAFAVMTSISMAQADDTDELKAEIADLIAFLESLTDERLLTNPDHADPWPKDHPQPTPARPAK